MRIHRLHLQHVKGVTDAQIELPDSGVVVLAGPNEVGKSTFLEALDRLLDPKAKAHSKAAAIVALQPVGQDVGPFVEAELSVGHYRVVFSKRWLRQSATTLRVLEPAPEQHTGEAAQARMTAIVDECLDRPLFEALRFAQVGPTSQIRLADSAVLAQALDAAAGADLHTDTGTDLLHAVETEYSRYFTSVSGRPSGELRSAMAACTQAQDAVAEAHRRLLEAEELVRSRDTLATQVQAAQRELPVLSAEQAHLADVVAEAERLRAREHEAARAMASARLDLERAEADLLVREGLSREVDERAESALARQKRLEACSIKADEAEEKLRVDTDALHAAKLACASGQADADVAAATVTHLAAAAELAALAQRVTSARAVQA
ncbi:MAG: AAA family ATPase, partial [Ornithinimicrobium sp.]